MFHKLVKCLGKANLFVVTGFVVLLCFVGQHVLPPINWWLGVSRKESRSCFALYREKSWWKMVISARNRFPIMYL